MTSTERHTVSKILQFINSDPGLKHLTEVADKVGVVGGAVRDIFTHNDPKDIDLIVLGLDTDEIISALKPFGHVDIVGKSFGVIVFKAENGDLIDIAIPRTEKKVGEGHTGFEITASKNISLDEDLMRRDFTFNSMVLFMDGTIHDPFDGLGSIRRKRIEIVNEKAFAEDPLRILRAVQFAVRFGFLFSDVLLTMTHENVSKVTELPTERTTKEFKKFGKGLADRTLGLRILDDLGISKVLFGDEINLGASKVNNENRMFAEMIFVSKARTSEEILEKFMLGAELADFFALVIPLFDVFNILAITTTPISELEMRMIGLKFAKFNTFFLDFVDLFHENFNKVMEDFASGKLPKDVKDLAVKGGDMMSMGLKGIEIGNMQKELLTLVLSNDLLNTEKSLTAHIRNAGKALMV
jgi:tRNA nucleotidyltransferase/poly(A) polymerase